MRFALSSITLIFVLLAYGQHNRITQFKGYKNLDEAFVYSIVQDSSGYLWVSTSNGVFRHDGFNFAYYSHDELVNDNFITASYFHKGKVWLGHRTGDITTVQGNTFKPITFTDSVMSSVVRFSVDPFNNLWAATYSDGLFKITDEKRIELYSFDNQGVGLQDFQFINKTQLLLCTDEGLRAGNLGLENTISLGEFVKDIPRGKIADIIKLSEEDYIIGTETNGIFWVIISDRSILVNPIVSFEDLEENILTSILLDEQWNLWVATMGGGLLKVTDIFTKENKAPQCEWIEGLTNNNIKYLYFDRDENIWLGSYGSGLTKIAQNPFLWSKASKILNNQSVAALAVTDNFTWVAINKGLQCLDANNNLIKQYIKGVDFPNVSITKLLAGNDDQIWIGTSGAGVYKLDGPKERFRRINISEGLLENNITCLANDQTHVWIGTQKGLARIDKDKENIEWFTIRNGNLPHNVINDIFIDYQSKVWVTTQSSALSYFEDGKFKVIRIPSQNNTVVLNSMTHDRDGNLWVGSNGLGVFRIQNDSVLNLQEEEGLFSNYCYSLLADDNGYIWVVHRSGLSRIHSRVLAVRSIQEYAGLSITDEFSERACLMDENGMLWFGTTKGILNYNSDKETLNMLPPILNLIGVSVNGVEKDPSKKLKLPSGRYKLRFNYVGISLKAPEKVKYQYRLLGLDDEWAEITTERTAYYSGIGSGKYIFELNASSSDGVSTAVPLRFTVIVKKPIWSYWWFYLAMFLIGSGLIFGYLKRREYKLIQANIRLEQGVKDRTREIERQKDEIECQGELIRKKNLDITDSIKYARTIQSAIFPPEVILEEALPEYFLINKPKDIVSGDFCWYTKSNGKYVIAVTDCTGHGVPGSIMSMLGITLFNEVVNNLKIINSAEILESMREKVISALNQHKKENPSYDGMNVGLCVLDNKKKTIQYSGAFHNLVYVSEGKQEVIRAERTPIGYSPLEMPKFKAHTIKYKSGDIFYMYSDGYQDQFGGDEDRKFTNKRLLSILHEIHDRSVVDQQLILEQNLTFWMQDKEQTDDIILLGFRL